MSHIRLTLPLLCLLVPAVAGAADGIVYVYVQPFPSDASRLTFALASVSAHTSTGAEHPLDVRLPAVGAAENSRQRLLAVGRLPVGSYAGFAFTVRRAALKGEQGEGALEAPEKPVTLDFPFVVTGQKASVIWLALDYQRSVSSGVAFSPVFSARVAPRPIASLAGFVSNANADAITVFDRRLYQVAAVIPTCGGPAGMALDQRSARLYVACSRDDEIQAIDAAAGEIVDRSRLMPGDGPRELALTPDGRTLVSVNTASDSLTFFDAGSLGRQQRVAVGSGPGSVLVDPAGRRVFTLNARSSTISVVDVATRSLVATISTDAAPLRGQFSAAGDRLFVIHERSPYVTVVDPRQLAVLRRARLRLGISAIKVDSRRGLLYIGGRHDTMVEVYDPNALVPVDAIRLRRGVAYLTIDDQENRLYGVSPDSSSVVVASLADRRVVSEMDVGDGPFWVAVMGER